MKKIIASLILLFSTSAFASASHNVEIIGTLISMNENVIKVKTQDKLLNVPRKALPKGTLPNSTITLNVSLAELIKMNKK